MLPIRDNVPWRGVAWAVLTIAVLNVAVLAGETVAGCGASHVVGLFGLIPGRFVGWSTLGGSAADPWRYLPLGTSMFLHDGWLHLVTNMLYLWTFGRALEAHLGYRALVGLYAFAGIAAAMGQIIAHPHSNAAMVGASGAIAGLLGAYLVYFPRARITVAFPFLCIPWVLEVRAAWLLLGWFGFQLARGVSDLLAASDTPQVAWWAHTTGFAAGAIAALVARAREAPAPAPAPVVRASRVPVRASLVPSTVLLRPSYAP